MNHQVVTSENGDAMAIWTECQGRRDGTPVMTMAAPIRCRRRHVGNSRDPQQFLVDRHGPRRHVQPRERRARQLSGGLGTNGLQPKGEQLGEPVRGGKRLAGAASRRGRLGEHMARGCDDLRSDGRREQGGRRLDHAVGFWRSRRRESEPAYGLRGQHVVGSVACRESSGGYHAYFGQRRHGGQRGLLAHVQRKRDDHTTSTPGTTSGRRGGAAPRASWNHARKTAEAPEWP